MYVLGAIAVAVTICVAFGAGLYLGWNLRDRNAYERGEAQQGAFVERPMAEPIGIDPFEVIDEEDRRRDG